MSLVACIVGKQLWNTRASDIEYEFSLVGERLNDKMNDIRDLTNRIGFWDKRVSELQGMKSRGDNLSNAVLIQAISKLAADGKLPAGGITPGAGAAAIKSALKGAAAPVAPAPLVTELAALFGGAWKGIKGLLGNLGKIKTHLSHAVDEKAKLETEQRMSHEEQQVLQRKKDMLDSQLKLAKTFGPAFEKMENDAVKRFAPKV